ncbi:MAG: hypothetical protein IKC10_05330 [Alphaproteobacteria bacterium]|nr:hypothetical protein [Alphaproteobacteria bacterium]
MEKILINNHAYFLGFELFHYKEEFDVKKVENFLLEKCRGDLIEYVGQTFLRTLPKLEDITISVKIKKAYQNSKYWFVIFELSRSMYKNYRGRIDNTFVYIQGNTQIDSITERGQGLAIELEGVEIYSCEE